MEAYPESIYRTQRRAFIAACALVHVDPIARLHPVKDKDGKPLFMDSAALGPRLAARAVLAIAADVTGSAIAIALLKAAPVLPKDGRLVLVHALDPAALAGVGGEPGWAEAMLGAVATEDLSRVRLLSVLPLGRLDTGPVAALAHALPDARMTLLPPVDAAAGARAAIAAAFRQ